ncbi:MAG: DUF3570 domain-containing protein [Burkholderiaceae bacterium]
MAATDNNTLAVVLAASALLSAVPLAQAQSAPEATTLSVKYGTYQDSQPGLDRVSVQAPTVYLQTPLAENWSFDGSWVSDSVSGPSPRMYDLVSSASTMSDHRTAGDAKLTRHFDRAAVSASVAYSTEHDYTSKTYGLQGRVSSDDNNSTFTVGHAVSLDRIDNTSNGVNTAIDQRKRGREFLVGWTQVLSDRDVVQANLTRTLARGYLNDPYKFLDQRPDSRNAWVALVRWNHHLAGRDAAVRSSYRLYRDTYGVQAHTVSLEWVQSTGPWTLTPGVRYHSQSAADFFVNPVRLPDGSINQGASIAAAVAQAGAKSMDQRLSAYGAVTLSLKTAYRLSAHDSVDVKVERYFQRAGWALGSGSAGMGPFNAWFAQVGWSHRF